MGSAKGTPQAQRRCASHLYSVIHVLNRASNCALSPCVGNSQRSRSRRRSFGVASAKLGLVRRSSVGGESEVAAVPAKISFHAEPEGFCATGS